jgi:hypothetical protein
MGKQEVSGRERRKEVIHRQNCDTKFESFCQKKNSNLDGKIAEKNRDKN